MRRAMLAAAILVMAVSAQAADMPDVLRGSFTSGPAPTVNWRGFYVGAQGGYGSSDESFGSSTKNAILLANVISGSVLDQMSLFAPNASGKASARTPGYGAFAGYNWQWDDVVAGLEMSYLHGSFGDSVTASRQFVSAAALSDGNFHSVNVTSTQTFAITDYATFRARAAYAYNCFLPYAFVGLALGNANISNSVTVRDSVSAAAIGPFVSLPALNGVDLTPNHLIYGYTAGLGIDINLIGGLFLRGEWEYVRFTAAIDTSINTVRAGLAYKF